MSTFVNVAFNPKTKKIQSAIFIDDYYGKHRYAVGFRKDGGEINIRDNIIKSECEIYPLEQIDTPPNVVFASSDENKIK
jgi:hypothetical protein